KFKLESKPKTYKDIEINHLAEMFEPSLNKNIEIKKEIPIECQAKIDDVNRIAINELDQNKKKIH
ncbi:13601_t:CDS:1, partial [Gigaspora margarita]